MINMTLTDEEREELINKNKEMIFKINEIYMDTFCLRDQLSKISIYDLVFSSKKRIIYSLLQKKIRIKNRRLLILQKKVELNEEILGIKKTKKKNKAL